MREFNIQHEKTPATKKKLQAQLTAARKRCANNTINLGLISIVDEQVSRCEETFSCFGEHKVIEQYMFYANMLADICSKK